MSKYNSLDNLPTIDCCTRVLYYPRKGFGVIFLVMSNVFLICLKIKSWIFVILLKFKQIRKSHWFVKEIDNVEIEDSNRLLVIVYWLYSILERLRVFFFWCLTCFWFLSNRIIAYFYYVKIELQNLIFSWYNDYLIFLKGLMNFFLWWLTCLIFIEMKSFRHLELFLSLVVIIIVIRIVIEFYFKNVFHFKSKIWKKKNHFYLWHLK